MGLDSYFNMRWWTLTKLIKDFQNKFPLSKKKSSPNLLPCTVFPRATRINAGTRPVLQSNLTQSASESALARSAPGALCLKYKNKSTLVAVQLIQSVPSFVRDRTQLLRWLARFNLNSRGGIRTVFGHFGLLNYKWTFAHLRFSDSARARNWPWELAGFRWK